ncbi:hypothetical protein ACVXG9_23095 [Escherichia coli]
MVRAWLLRLAKAQYVCMQMAMHGVDTPIDYLNSHGTSTPVGDVKELAAIREVLGDKARRFLQPSHDRSLSGRCWRTGSYLLLLMLEHGLSPTSTLKSWTSRLRV